MTKVEFSSMAGFLVWAMGRKPTTASFPFNGSGQWNVVITCDGEGDESTLEITSGFYTVKAHGSYGAPMIVGHRVQFGGVEASGMVEFGFTQDDPLDMRVVNRRRITEHDELGEGKIILGTIQACPDRVDEPVAVVIKSSDLELFKKRSEEEWDFFANQLRDGVELMAMRLLRRHAR